MNKRIQGMPRELPTWKIIHIGTHTDIPAVKKSFTKSGCKISTPVLEIMDKAASKLSDKEQEVELVEVSGTDLGFSNEMECFDFYNHTMAAFNLTLCQPEDAIYLREQFLDQPKGEHRLMAMKPIVVPGGNTVIFRIRHYGKGLFLDTFYGHPGGLWYPGDIWIFRRRSQAQL